MNSNLGENPFDVGFDYSYGLVEKVFTETGGILHMINGILFRDGKPESVTTMYIEDLDNISSARDMMLSRFHMVAHIFEAWDAPPDGSGIKPSEHPERRDVIMIMLYTKDAVATMSCPINTKKKTIKRGSVHMPEKMHGSLAWDIPSRPLSS